MLEPNGEMNIYIRRHLKDGSSTMIPVTMSALSPDYAEAGVSLHNEVASGLKRDIFAASTEEEVRQFFTDEGLAVGVRFNDRLISLRTLKTGKDWVDKALKDFGVSPDVAPNSAVTGFCVVHKCFRGNNVQFLTQFYAENIIARKFDSIVTTVSPWNIFSLQNVLACGYNIIGIEWTYGDYLRYVLKKTFRNSHPVWTHGHLQIPIRNIDWQREALKNGNVGYRIIRKPIQGFCILYGKYAEKSPY